AQEFDGSHGSQRQRVNRHVKAAVHERKDASQGEKHELLFTWQPKGEAPGPAQGTEYQRGANDPEPGDAQHVDVAEQKDSEGGTQIVEERAGDKVGLRRHLPSHRIQQSGRGSVWARHVPWIHLAYPSPARARSLSSQVITRYCPDCRSG